MSITIEVTAKCQALTQRGTRCTREATKDESRFNYYSWSFTPISPIELIDSEHTNKRWRPQAILDSGTVIPGAWVENRLQMQGIPSVGFVCNTHARR